ncbi:MAG: NAD(P)H-hydrate dehydratase [Thermoplasmatota archaeon]
MISPLDVSILDRNSEYLGIDVSRLMEAAGRSLADEMIGRYPGKGTVTFLIGPGNNGGDGCVAARHLSEEEIPVKVMLSRDPSGIGTLLARKAYGDLTEQAEVGTIVDEDVAEWVKKELEEASIVVDGLLGAGSKGAPRGKFKDIIRAANSADALKVAVDSPTGMGFENCFRADITVTFHDIKHNMYSGKEPLSECGRIIVKDIGIPEEAARIVGPGDLLRYPEKDKDSKKGSAGKVLIIGGGPFVGAPVLAARAASRVGADLVRVAVPKGIADTVSGFSTEVIVNRLDTLDPYELGPEVMDDLNGPIDWCHAVLIGPGSGRSRSTLHTLRSVFDEAVARKKSVVLDADALTAISEIGQPIKCGGADVLLTPHRGELKRILLSYFGEGDDYRAPTIDKENGIEWETGSADMVSRLVHDTGATVLGKGPADLIAGLGRHSLSDHISMSTRYGDMLVRFNKAGVPQMSVGGTGDVLAGLCTGLMSLGLEAFDAASMGAYINGEAGERSFGEIGHSLSASDMVSRVRVLPP